MSRHSNSSSTVFVGLLKKTQQLDNMQLFIFQKVYYSLFLLPVNIFKLFSFLSLPHPSLLD